MSTNNEAPHNTVFSSLLFILPPQVEMSSGLPVVELPRLFLPKCSSSGFTSALHLYFFVFTPYLLLPNRQPKHSQYFSPLAWRCRSNQDISSAVWGLCAVRDVQQRRGWIWFSGTTPWRAIDWVEKEEGWSEAAM